MLHVLYMHTYMYIHVHTLYVYPTVHVLVHSVVPDKRCALLTVGESVLPVESIDDVEEKG